MVQKLNACEKVYFNHVLEFSNNAFIIPLHFYFICIFYSLDADFFSIQSGVKPVIGQSQPEVRNVREEVVLARLRIGHTRITHSYLLKRAAKPCFLGAMHSLQSAIFYLNVMKQYFHVDTIEQLFNDVPVDNVFLFLKEINIFNKTDENKL